MFSRTHTGVGDTWDFAEIHIKLHVMLYNNVDDHNDNFVANCNYELSSLANVFIVAPESLASLFEGTPSIRKDAMRYFIILSFVMLIYNTNTW